MRNILAALGAVFAPGLAGTHAADLFACPLLGADTSDSGGSAEGIKAPSLMPAGGAGSSTAAMFWRT